MYNSLFRFGPLSCPMLVVIQSVDQRTGSEIELARLGDDIYRINDLKNPIISSQIYKRVTVVLRKTVRSHFPTADQCGSYPQ